jgi:tRNA/tmRNA/rRNA uracil-C5-methylase (TrmA/RlmC/RlmD family)
LQLKDRARIKIEKIAFGGEGVGRINNLVVFIPFAAPGDELEIEITGCKKKFARGRILKIVKASPQRVKPLCKYYEHCGGCCYQHLSYEHQLEIKKLQVEEVFKKIGSIAAPPVAGTVASPEIYHYRGKAQFHRVSTSTVPQLGFLDISGGKIVDIERCEIMEETINKKISRLREDLFIRNQKDARLNAWSELPADYTNRKGQMKRLAGGREFLVPTDGFFQANLFLTDALAAEVCSLATSGQVTNLIDAYCGCGLFSILLAPVAGNILGIELNEESIKFARINAEKENIKNVKYIQGDVEKILAGRHLSPEGEIDVIILDPPRAGCSKMILESIASMRPRKIIYVSCNPATQARDIKFLCENGYNLLRLLPFDMFPQTQHIEVLGLLAHN